MPTAEQKTFTYPDRIATFNLLTPALFSLDEKERFLSSFYSTFPYE
jgi:hypothetical protein